MTGEERQFFSPVIIFNIFCNNSVIAYERKKLYNKVDQLYKELLYLQQKYKLEEMEIYTTPALIYKVF